MFGSPSIRALPMSLAHHFSFCDAPTMLEVGQSLYPPSGTSFAAMSPPSFALDRRRVGNDRWRNQRNEVRAAILPDIT